MTPNTTNLPAENSLWLYGNAYGEAAGPVPFSELQRLVESGELTQSTYVVEAGGTRWRTFAEVATQPVTHNAQTNPNADGPVPLFEWERQQWERSPLSHALVFFFWRGNPMHLWRSNLFPTRTKILASLAGVGLAILALAFIVGIFSSLNGTPPQAKSDSSPAPENADTPEGRDRALIQAIAKEQFGQKLRKVEVVCIMGGPQQGLYNVELRFDASGGWSNSSQRRWMEDKMRDTYERLFTECPNVWEAWCFAEAKLIDRFGQESMEIVYKTSMGKSVAAQVKWANKARLDFKELWKTHFLHPAILKD